MASKASVDDTSSPINIHIYRRTGSSPNKWINYRS